MQPQIGELPGGRMHLQHGPIDLVIKISGDSEAVTSGHAAAIRRFQTVLAELTAELADLRKPLTGPETPVFQSLIAGRMLAACWPHRAQFITPMAAVAGSVADDIMAAILAEAPALASAYVNNGGDIAVHVTGEARLRIGVVADLVSAVPDGMITLAAGSGIGGIATSGWRGRSFSLGIADAVTVLAQSAADADAAATLIANAVNVDHPAIRRVPARHLDPDCDLCDLPVTTAVGSLPPGLEEAALDCGTQVAQRFIAEGRISAAFLILNGTFRVLPAGTEKRLS